MINTFRLSCGCVVAGSIQAGLFEFSINRCPTHDAGPELLNVLARISKLEMLDAELQKEVDAILARTMPAFA